MYVFIYECCYNLFEFNSCICYTFDSIGGMYMKKNVTFSDIAKYTNFSKTTISRYFNSPETLTEESIKKIEHALVALNYQENKVAKSLANGKTEMIGVIIPNLYMHYYAHILNYLIQTYRQYHYKFIVFLGNSNPEEELKYIQELLAYKIEGMIMLSHSIDSLTLKNLDIPIVSIEREDQHISSVNSDNYDGAKQATQVLIDNDCDILIHINSKVSETVPAYQRIVAFQETCSTQQIPHQCYFSSLGNCYEESYQALYTIYVDIEKNYPNRKKGIFLSNDTHANVFLNILLKHKKQIPEEYELIGFDNSPISEQAILPITTVDQHVAQLSEAAMKCLIRQIHAKRNKTVLNIEHATIPTTLIKRETTK